MADVKLGDRIRAKISYGDGGSLLPAEEGTVVYVHPEGRFYTLEFSFPDRYGGVQKFREAYIMAPPPERLAPAKPVNPHLMGQHYNRESRVALRKYLESL